MDPLWPSYGSLYYCIAYNLYYNLHDSMKYESNDVNALVSPQDRWYGFSINDVTAVTSLSLSHERSFIRKFLTEHTKSEKLRCKYEGQDQKIKSASGQKYIKILSFLCSRLCYPFATIYRIYNSYIMDKSLYSSYFPAWGTSHAASSLLLRYS